MKTKITKAKLEVKVWIGEQRIKVKRFYINHRQEILILGPIVIPMIYKVIMNAMNKGAKLKEIKIKNTTIWDPSARHRWTLRRQLTSQEWLEVNRRQEQGQKLGDILESMKVLY